jgi:hypothetical protein
MTPEEANLRDSKGTSWLLQNLLLGNPVPKELWIPKESRIMNENGWCPLGIVVFQRRTHELPDLGKYFICEDERGENPLHWCAGWGYEQETSFFIQKGANPSIKNRLGKSPIDIAETFPTGPRTSDPTIANLLKAEVARRHKRLLRGPETFSL